VSLSSSIFQKPCPGCASSVSVSAARCDCGHVFETASNNLTPLEASLRDEELYEGYLAARAEQAHQVSYAAERALADDTEDPMLASDAALAREVAKSIDDDLAEQRKKIAAIQNALRKSQPVAPAPVAAAVIPEPAMVAEKPAPTQPIVTPTAPERPAPVAVSVTPEPVALVEKPAPTRTIVTPAAPVRPAPTVSIEPISAPIVHPSTAAAIPIKPASAPTWQATTAQKAAGVLAAIKSAKVRESLARAKKAVVAAATAEHKPTPTPAPSTAPPSAFRKEQASKAEKIMETHKRVDAKECPNCTASVPVNTTRCQCGFAFITGGNELPSLTLCTGDFTALRNSLKLNLR
jgi:hypothetical protein